MNLLLKILSFNLIVLNQVIEHIPEPDILLKKLNTKVNKRWFDNYLFS